MVALEDAGSCQSARAAQHQTKNLLVMCVANPREGAHCANSNRQVRRHSYRENGVVTNITIAECIHDFKNQPERAR